jgi:lipid-binding SYLF domain-containing protein
MNIESAGHRRNRRTCVIAEQTSSLIMKRTLIASMTLALAATAFAIDKAELDQRVRTLTAKFESLQRQPDKSIPADILRKAKGIVLLDRTKAGFLFAYQGGGGVALARDPGTQEWSSVAFVSATEASLGFQIGGEQTFFVILLMNTNVTRLLTEPNFDFGGEARGTAGDASTGVEGSLNKPEQPVLVYDDRKGLYGGVAIKGGAIAPDNDANRLYYEQFVAVRDILFDKKVRPTEASNELTAKISENCRNSKP